MASSTPPHCSITATKPTQNHHYPQNHHHLSRFSLPPTRNASAAAAAAKPAATTTTPLSQNPNFPTLSPLPPSKSELGNDFRGRRSTRLVSKMHFNRPKTSVSTRHTSAAEEALQQALSYNTAFESVLQTYESKLSGSDDYGFLLRELGNRGECLKAVQCFEFAVQRERKRNEQGKLASAMISILGRLGRVDLAKNVFDTANRNGYGNTVYSFSALISAYGRSGHCEKALQVFEAMKKAGLKPNLVTYNAVIDAYAKGGVEIGKAVEVFDEMVRNGVQPDRITFNSLLAVCSRCGLWEDAKNLFHEMVYRGIEQDIFTYNTLLDAVCKGGQMELAFDIMAEMSEKRVWPNVVTYSTMIDGCAKAGKYEEALNLFEEMKHSGIGLDRVSYNTLLAIYASLGRFEDALGVCKAMEQSGIKKDVVTYNALLRNYGKQWMYDDVKKLFIEMKTEKFSPNLLTYSTLIDVYSKGGLYQEAIEIFRELKKSGLEADVVLYSALIDALCKNGLVESAVSLLDEMTREGKSPNVVTYNCIIDAFGRSAIAQYQDDAYETNESRRDSSTCMALIGADESKREDEGQDDRVMKFFEQLAAEKGYSSKEDANGKSQELSCILGLFHRMHELKIKPNVVTFSAILNACSRCNSFEDASMLLEELRLFDNQVYGVAHGLLMGNKENVWFQAQSLFDEVKRMDPSTASAFYNALTDMLWHFGQKKGAQLVVLEGKRRHVWENAWCDSCLDLHLMSSGAAQAMLHAWLLNIRDSIVFDGHELPKLVSILTGWGKHSKVAGDGTLRRVIEALLISMGSPFRNAECNIGRFISKGAVVAAWLKESRTLKVLILHDDRIHSEHPGLNNHPDLHILKNGQTLHPDLQILSL